MKPIPSLSRTLALTAPAVALTLTAAHAASDYLLEIDGIKGESKDEKHSGAIELESFSWGCSNAGTGRSQAITLSLGKRIDKSSPLLMLACAKGNHIPTATLTVRKSSTSGGGKTDYYQITLSDILVSSYQSGGGGGSGGTAGDTVPTDQISFNYSKIEFKYIVTDANGDPDPAEQPVVVTHDFNEVPQ